MKPGSPLETCPPFSFVPSPSMSPPSYIEDASLNIQLAFVNKEQMRPWRLILTIEVNGVSATYGKSALKAVSAVSGPVAI
jgi:hypothetical protein